MNKHACLLAATASLAALGWAVATPGTTARAEPALQPTWTALTAPPAAATDVALLKPLAAMIKADLLPHSLGRTAFDLSGRRIAVVPTTTGQLCINAERDGRPEAGLCGLTFTASGAEALYSAGTNQPDRLIGLVADDVERLEVSTSDGEIHLVPIRNGAFWWDGPPNITVRSMISHRGGERYVESALFNARDSAG